jgi:branched-chain amino acid transport system permease protein
VSRRGLVILIAFAALALVPPVAGALGEPYFVKLAARVMLFAIAALSLDLILGYGGLVSFGHAAFLGVGGYAVGILAAHGVDDVPTRWLVAIAASAVIAGAIGAVSLLTRGVYFIMITLAFAQMLYYLAISLAAYGGDDGLRIDRRGTVGGYELSGDVPLYYVILAVLALSLWTCGRIVESRFGRVLTGARSNERRMAAIGFSVYRYQLAAFVMAGALCGLAGALTATLDRFISPAVMHWSRSGEIMVMVILGGMGTLVGPILGAAGLWLGEEALKSYTEHWQLVLGPLLVLLVLFARRGLYGLVAGRPMEPAPKEPPAKERST